MEFPKTSFGEVPLYLVSNLLWVKKKKNTLYQIVSHIRG